MSNPDIVYIGTDGATEVLALKEATFTGLKEKIGARMGEYVYLRDGIHALLVDEEGLLEGKQINEFASALASTPIVGDAMLVNLAATEDIPYE